MLWGWILVYSIGDSRSTNFVKMKRLGWPLIFLWYGQICVPVAVAILEDSCIAFANMQVSELWLMGLLWLLEVHTLYLLRNFLIHIALWSLCLCNFYSFRDCGLKLALQKRYRFSICMKVRDIWSNCYCKNYVPLIYLIVLSYNHAIADFRCLQLLLQIASWYHGNNTGWAYAWSPHDPETQMVNKAKLLVVGYSFPLEIF